MNKTQPITCTYCRAGFGGTPTAPAWLRSQTGILVSQFRVRQLADRNALRNPQRQHVPTVTNRQQDWRKWLERNFESKDDNWLEYP